ncbi:MAG: GumC family protein, partial [Novosphingobium sp.]
IAPGAQVIQEAANSAPDATGLRTDQVDTELQILQSRALAGQVFDRLKLVDDSDFMERVQTKSGPLASVKRALGLGGSGNSGMIKPAEGREMAIDYLTKGLDISRIVTTAYALQISFTDYDAARAAKITNGYAETYLDYQVGAKKAENDKLIASLSSRIEQLRVQAQTDFGAVQRYRIANNLLSTNGTALTEQEISTYNQQVAIARSDAARDRAAYDAARRQVFAGGGAAGDTQSAPVIAALRAQRGELAVKVADLATRDLETNPELIAARNQLAALDAQIVEETSRTLSAFDAKARASESRMGSLAASLGGATGKLAVNNGAMIALDDLNRKAQASQALYDSYLNRYKEVVARSGAERADSRILSSARVPGSPSSPNLVLNLALGTALGLLLGVAAAILAESNFRGLTTGDDVERRIGLSFFGGVPLFHSANPHEATALQTIAAHPGDIYSESVRSVLASLRQSNNSRNQVIAITSALPGEGKSTLAVSLARVAGLSGERVAIIDADAIRGRVASLYGVPAGAPGLRELFGKKVDLDAARHVDPVDNVSVFAIGSPFAEGERLTEKGRIQKLVAKLRERYDLIILDCPPLLPIAEARELVTIADNVLIVARWRESTDGAVRAAIKLLPLQTVSHIGVALNGIDLRKKLQLGGNDATAFYSRYKSYYRSEPA